MKLWLFSAVFSVALAVQGTVYTYSGSPSQEIPDDYTSGWGTTFNFESVGLQISDVTVTFTTSGGYNGDLYAYLTHGSSTLVLLNRVGVANGTSDTQLFDNGYSGSGFNNITVSDSGAGNIHNYGGSTLNSTPTVGGTYKADGQTASPVTAPTGYGASGGSATFANTFGGSDPNGDWVLYFSDASGGSAATLNSWSVGITTVPEPVNAALSVFGLLFVAASVLRFCRRRDSK